MPGRKKGRLVGNGLESNQVRGGTFWTTQGRGSSFPGSEKFSRTLVWSQLSDLQTSTVLSSAHHICSYSLNQLENLGAKETSVNKLKESSVFLVGKG